MARGEVRIDEGACRKIVAAGALYDLLAVGPLATPWTAPWQLEFMNYLNGMGGFKGNMPDFLPIDLLFINLFGMVVLVWVIARLTWPNRGLATGDLAVRLGVSAILGWYALQGSVNGIVWIFLVLELMFAAANWFAIRMTSPTTLTMAAP